MTATELTLMSRVSFETRDISGRGRRGLLAMEQAAARVWTMSVAEIADGMAGRRSALPLIVRHEHEPKPGR